MRGIIIGIIAISIIGGSIFLTRPYWDRDRIAFLWENQEEEKISEDINVLALGRVAEGQGGRWHAAPGLVDAIVIINYKPKTGTVNLVSLPRDLYAEIDGEELKINRIYQKNKIDEFMVKVQQITGIPVDKYIVIDLEIIEKAVDELGGIDVILEENIVDSVSGFKLSAGEQHINGEDTVWIIRNRYSKDGDFFREKNQHIVIGAVFSRFDSLSVIGKTKFLFSMVPSIRESETNFSVGEIIPKFDEVAGVRFNSVVLGFDTGLLKSSYIPVNSSSSAYVLIPVEGLDKYEAIRAYIEEKLVE